MPEAELETKLLGKSTLASAMPQCETTAPPNWEYRLLGREPIPPSFAGQSVSHSSVPSSNCLPGSLARILIVAVASAIATGCSGPPVNAGPLFGTGVFHPPPKVGDSITHTRLCECKACDPGDCCDGPEDDAPPTRCSDSYDFSANAECGGLSVRSCVSRCIRQVWRVHAGQACDSKRPANCCEAG